MTNWYKRLAPNDTGATSGNMAGFLVPAKLVPLFPILPPPSPPEGSSAISIRAQILRDGTDKGVVESKFQLQTWGGTRTPEYRVTGALDPILGPAKGADLITIEILEPGKSYRFEVLSQGTPRWNLTMSRRINTAGARGDWGVISDGPIPGEPHVPDFKAGLIQPPAGPPPFIGTRILETTSGPAATYCFQLAGQALDQILKNVTTKWTEVGIFKVGFSNNPKRRLSEINNYLPDESVLSWKPHLVQWHTDEINAWTLEQAIFVQLSALGATWIKGEIYATKPNTLMSAWATARQSAERPAVDFVEIQTDPGSKVAPAPPP